MNAATLALATVADVAAVAALQRRVRTACLPYLPDLHSPGEYLAFFRDRVFPNASVVIARATAILGFCALRPGWIDHLYVEPASQHQGLGSRLLAAALAGQTDVQLWVFQRNSAAIDFYRGHGFTEQSCSDGSGNKENEPDMLMAWRQS